MAAHLDETGRSAHPAKVLGKQSGLIQVECREIIRDDSTVELVRYQPQRPVSSINPGHNKLTATDDVAARRRHLCARHRPALYNALPPKPDGDLAVLSISAKAHRF